MRAKIFKTKIFRPNRLVTAAFAAALGCLGWSTAHATLIPLGDVQWDVTIPGSFGEFDIVNQTGPNSSPPTWPVTTEVQFNSLSLVVHFSDGSTSTFGPSYFTLAPDGESLDGASIAIGGVSPQPTRATLTGDLTPTTLDVNGTPTTVNSAFETATILPSSPPNLADGDFAIINAVSGVVPPPVPEPNMTLTLLLGCIMTLFVIFRLRRRGLNRTLTSLGAVCSGVVLLAAGSAHAVATTLQQNAASTPGSGVAGVSFINITATGFPGGSINPAHVTIRLAPTCTVGSSTPVSGEADATASSIRTILGSSDRVNFEVPSRLLSGTPITSGTYMAQIVDTTDGFSGGNCSIVTVTTTNPTLNACVPSSSMGVVAGHTVTAYVPKGSWGTGTTGIGAVEIEPTPGPGSAIPTASEVNSCAGNPATAQVACTANNNTVYLVSGTTLTNTLTSNLSGFASFSGGSCTNCGVAINALTNTAVIAGGLTGSVSGDGLQVLNLSTNTFQTPVGTTEAVSEDISIDPGRNLILSPNEHAAYPLFSLNSSTGAITGELDRPGVIGGEGDSAAEDCSTGIALSSVEFTNNVYLADLSQATFTSGSPGSWTSPQTIFTLSGSNLLPLAAGTTGISVAQGSSHLAIVTGEFGGNTFAVLQLQPKSGTGGATPTVVDWVVGAMPSTPDGNGFSAGFDPHTVTAYTSPNTGKAIGLYADWFGGAPKFVGVIDLAAALAAPRDATSTHQIATGTNLITTGVVSYVAVP